MHRLVFAHLLTLRVLSLALGDRIGVSSSLHRRGIERHSPIAVCVSWVRVRRIEAVVAETMSHDLVRFHRQRRAVGSLYGSLPRSGSPLIGNALRRRCTWGGGDSVAVHLHGATTIQLSTFSKSFCLASRGVAVWRLCALVHVYVGLYKRRNSWPRLSLFALRQSREVLTPRLLWVRLFGTTRPSFASQHSLTAAGEPSGMTVVPLQPVVQAAPSASTMSSHYEPSCTGSHHAAVFRWTCVGPYRSSKSLLTRSASLMLYFLSLTVF